MENISAEKQEWFDNLPKESGQTNKVSFERTCPCGAFVWYFEGDAALAAEWIDIHFGHTSDIANPVPLHWIDANGCMWALITPIKSAADGQQLREKIAIQMENPN